MLTFHSHQLHLSNFLLFIFLLTIKPSYSDSRSTSAALVCSNRTAPTPLRQTFIANFLNTLDAVSPLINTQRYATAINGTGNATVFTFGECMRDLSQMDCNLCFANCKTQIPRCRPFQLATRGGRSFFDGCYLRYDDYNFFNESVSPEDQTVCSLNDTSLNQTAFRSNTIELVRNLSSEANRNDGFAVGTVNRSNVSVYGLAQCWKFVRGSGCQRCLANAVSTIGSCLPKEEGRVLNAGCYFRYSTQKFYDNSSAIAVPNIQRGSRLAVILAVISSVVAFVLIVSAAAYFLRKKILKRRREKKQLGPLLATANKSNLNFSYETLEKATNYFNESNKLGQGGSGSVYKGILADGKPVAIKRLFFNTRQWVDHFFNEVNLISGISHKNLVKLLGCSITGPESLLVYEYVPNQSLHDYFFDKENVKQLPWELRFNIILGIAEGLRYLHEESELRIIHRDIKLSNILLDENLTPKIADFGLVRLFPEDKTHISTAIAGTLGYMAPEYVVRGKLTEKADVYSFGVVVIEVICGKKNNNFFQDSGSILQMIWSLYTTQKLHEAVDPSLEGNFEEEKASRLLQIGLLCVQASATLRPSMSSVVNMLTDGTELPEPTQPPFLNPGSAETSRNIPLVNYFSQHDSNTASSANDMTGSIIEPR